MCVYVCVCLCLTHVCAGTRVVPHNASGISRREKTSRNNPGRGKGVHSHYLWRRSGTVRCRSSCCRSCRSTALAPARAVRSGGRPATVVVGTVTSAYALEVNERLHLAVEERSAAPLPRDLARRGLDVRPRP